MLFAVVVEHVGFFSEATKGHNIFDALIPRDSTILVVVYHEYRGLDFVCPEERGIFDIPEGHFPEAGTLAALCAGAQVASTALNGMGERAGCAATEEVALALSILYGVDMGLDLSKFYEASVLLQRYSGVKLQRHKAVTGTGAFAQEAGLVVTGWKELPFTAEPYLPELVGQKASLLLGKKSGRDSIVVKLNEMGISASEEEVGKMLKEVKERAQKTKEPIGDEEFETIVRQVTQKKMGGS